MFENPTVNLCSLQLVCEDRALLVWADPHVSLCLQQHTNASEQFVSCIQLFFYKLGSSLNRTNKNLKELRLEIQASVPW